MKTLQILFEEQVSLLAAWLTPERVFLSLLLVLGVIAIPLFHMGVLPLSLSYALFYFSLLFLFGLYRPTWLWQGVVFFLPFEIIILATVPGTADFRSYQFALLALLAASSILWLQGKVRLPRLRWFDGALALILLGAVFSLVTQQPYFASLQETVVLFSFALLYFFGRVFLSNKEEVKTFLLTFQISGLVVSGYALYQTLAFKYSAPHFMVMAGRPNSVFEEADWLGFFLGLVLLVSFVGFLRAQRWSQLLWSGALSVTFLTTLIVTVSRSAWLGAAGAIVAILFILALQYFSGFFGAGKEKRQAGSILKRAFISAPLFLILAIGITILLGLTRFDLSQRFSSTGTGDQVITIACQKEGSVPEKIESVAALSSLGCEHINLEDQVLYEERGLFIATTKRPDPNIAIRQNIYQHSWQTIREHFALGIGWGESARVLGTDGRGAGLNSSNLFLEVWLGSGLLGFFGLLIFWFGFLVRVLMRLIRKREITEGFWLTILFAAFWVHATLFNFFNAGFLLASFIATLFLFAWYLEKTAPTLKSLWQK